MTNEQLLRARVSAVLAVLACACTNGTGQQVKTVGPGPGSGLPSGAGVTGGIVTQPSASGTAAPTNVGSAAGTGAPVNALPGVGMTGVAQAGTGAGVTGTAGATTTTAGQTGAAGMSALAGSGGMVAVAGTGASGAGASGTGAMSDIKPPCETKASQVIIMGDSYTNWPSHTFPQDMAKAAGETYRLYGQGGYSMASGGLGLIPPEFDAALADDPNILAAIVDGGGNDIVVADAGKWGADAKAKCTAADKSAPMQPVCQMIVAAAQAAGLKLLLHMADKGVKDIVFFYYPEQPLNTTLGGADPNPIRVYAKPGAKKNCDDLVTMSGGKARCHWLDLEPIFMGHPEWFASGDVHENSQGSAQMAKAIWQIMKDNCIAQKASSGCCMP